MHDVQHATKIYRRIGHALHATHTFAPCISWDEQTLESVTPSGQTIQSVRHRPAAVGMCEVVQHARETPDAYAARVHCTPYVNHLSSSVSRFCAYLGRRKPTRTGDDAEILRAFSENCDGRGNGIDAFLASFSFDAKARGCGIILLDGPEKMPESMADQIAGRKVPRAIKIMPEHVSHIEYDDDTGAVVVLEINARIKDKAGKRCDGIRGWDEQNWYTKIGDEVIESRPHGFKACPAIVFTEDGGGEFGFVGKYAQIVGLSVFIWNTSSLISAQTRGISFPILTIKTEQYPGVDGQKPPTKLGQSNALEYSDERPGFISPDMSNIDQFLKCISEAREEIARISGDNYASASAESGEALRRRFEPLNAELSRFATALQSLERKMWELYCGWLDSATPPQVEYPTDFNVTDTMTEIGILEAMKAAGMPQISIIAKMHAIAGAEFDSADEEVKDKITAALDEMERGLAYGANPVNGQSA